MKLSDIMAQSIHSSLYTHSSILPCPFVQIVELIYTPHHPIPMCNSVYSSPLSYHHVRKQRVSFCRSFMLNLPLSITTNMSTIPELVLHLKLSRSCATSCISLFIRSYTQHTANLNYQQFNTSIQ